MSIVLIEENEEHLQDMVARFEEEKKETIDKEKLITSTKKMCRYERTKHQGQYNEIKEIKYLGDINTNE